MVSAGGWGEKGRVGGSNLTPHPEWDVLAASMFSAPSVTNCVDAMYKK